jgi:hypothetical protein
MRLALLLLLSVAACEDDGPLDSEKDMTMTVTHDLSTTGTTCAAAVQCSMACTGATAATCSSACFSNVTADAQPYATALLGCIQNKCTPLGGDGGTTDCSDPQSTTCSACVQAKCLSEASACVAH